MEGMCLNDAKTQRSPQQCITDTVAPAKKQKPDSTVADGMESQTITIFIHTLPYANRESIMLMCRWARDL